jgi:hypothetical protein
MSDLLAKVKLVVNDGIDIFPAHDLGLSSVLNGKSWRNCSRSISVLVLQTRQGPLAPNIIKRKHGDLVGEANRR